MGFFFGTGLNTSVIPYTIQVVEPPASEPVSAEELHAHLDLNIELEVVSAQLEEFITAAREQFEILTDGRIVSPTVFVQSMERFPCSGQLIELKRGNVLSVDGITYFDADDNEQELEDYESDLSGIPALIRATIYPPTSTNKIRPVAIEFTAGWEVGSDRTLPELVRLAIMELAGHYYEVRESHATVDYKEVPLGFATICAKYRTGLGGI